METPRLSYSIAKLICQKSPKHAWLEHRLLGGSRTPATDAQKFGKIIESQLFIGKKLEGFEILDVDSFRIKDAKKQRDEAIQKGLEVVKKSDYDNIIAASKKLLEALEHRGIYFTEAIGELNKRIEWESDGVLCSGEIDHFIKSETDILIRDLKKTSDASPKNIQRDIVKYGYDIQHAAYCDYAAKTFPEYAGRIMFEFIFVEDKSPYCVSIARFDGTMKELGERRWNRSKETWKNCLENNFWPGYSEEPVYVEALPWQLAEEEIY